MLKIVEPEYKWNGTLTKRNATKYIVIHHCAGNGTPASIHNSHIKQGWTGIGYHFYVRKDGSIWRGRPISVIGAHCAGHNHESIGICFEGNFETENKIANVQLRAGKALVTYVNGLYPNAQIKKHKDFGGTACPGRYFPFDEIRKGEMEMSVEEAVEIVQAKAGLEEGTIDFLLCYKYGEELLIKLAEAMI